MIQENWVVFTADDTRFVFDMNQVSKIERELRKEGMPYRTIYYRDNEPIKYVEGKGYEVMTNEEVSAIIISAQPSNSEDKKILSLDDQDKDFVCHDPEGVLEITKTLEAAATKEGPYIMQVTDEKGTRPYEASREEFLDHYINWSIDQLYCLVDPEE
ncbi:hypothetical protein [Paraliobacillus sediminis]|uniref:hypothetical protein n=1 Tax=Paraliobacillus sediminis TaxID=1885916 RepID=UPI000E3DD15F|nr:hypothetical protein [Paraliobacillus sediminis]